MLPKTLLHNGVHFIEPVNVLINVDWLALTLHFEYEKSIFYEYDTSHQTPKSAIKFITKRSDSSTKKFTQLSWILSKDHSKFFRRSYTITAPYDDGLTNKEIILGKIEVEHNGNIAFGRNTARLKLQNNLLYSEQLQAFIYLIFSHIMLDNHKMDAYTISRLDICADNFNEMRDILSTYRDRLDYSNSYKNNNGRKMNAHVFDFNKREFESFTLGSNKTGLYFSLYHKGDELKISQKEYIKDLLRDQGYDLSNTYRFEIRLTRDFAKGYTEQGNFFDPEFNNIKPQLNILSPDFYTKINQIYWNIINDVLKLTIDGIPIKFLYKNPEKIIRNKFDKLPNYRTEKQICTYYLRQYFDHHHHNYWLENYYLFAQTIIDYSPYNLLYLERKFIEISLVNSKKKEKINLIYDFIKILSSKTNQSLSISYEKKYDKLLSRSRSN
jgi:hypothetical protein